MMFEELVINLLFLWMGVGMGVLLIHYKSIKSSQKKNE